MSDIRKWFMKKHDTSTGNGNASNSAKPSASDKPSSKPEKLDGQESSGRKKTSKYFAKDKAKEEKEVEESPSKRKAQRDSEELSGHGKPPPGKKAHKAVGDDDDDFVLPTPGKDPANITPSKKLKSSSGRGVPQKSIDNDNDADDGGSCDGDTKSNLKSSASRRGGKSSLAARTSGRKMDVDESDDDGSDEKDIKTPKPGGRGRGRGAAATPSSGRGRGGGGRGGFMNFGERKDPPHKGEKEVPEGAPDCLAGLTFVISGTLDSLEREEAEDLIKRHGGRVTGSVSKKTNYLLCDEDIGGRKSEKAKELGTVFLTEDGLFDKIRASKKSKTTQEPKKPKDEIRPSPKKESLQKPEAKISVATKELTRDTSSARRKVQSSKDTCLPWPEKYRPKTPDELVGNQALVKQLEEWLVHWDDLFLNASKVKGKAKKQNDANAKKAVLLSGTPGIGKTTSAKLISRKLGFQAVEVNASDSRGKADSKIVRGIGGRTSNSIKELVSNESLHAKAGRSPHSKTILIMDEVDGMSGGDRGGVADLIASIKASKIPIICICNDRYSQKLKSLVNHCLLLSFRKPTKQQMAKRLLQIANAEGLQVNQIALEELAERVNGDMRMALNQLQYLSLSKSVINYDDIRQRLQASSKDEDMSPFTAVDKLFGFNAGKLMIDERIGLCMSDPDLVPLIIQENYINYRPSCAPKDANGLQRMNLVARAAESIADGDIVNVQIRRYQQWQLSQMGSLASSIIPSALLHGSRETLEQGERNYNRFGGWLGKNSTMGKNYRLLEDLRFHLLASSESILERRSLRLDYMTLLRKKLTDPLRTLAKDEAVENVVDFMDSYSITQDDFDSIMEISKFQGHSNPMDGIQPAVKAALTKAYNKGSSSRVIRTADLITLPGLKKAPKKRVAAMLEPVDENLAEENGDTLQEDEEGNSDAEEDDLLDPEKKVQLDLQNLNSKGIQVDMEIKGSGTSGKKAPAAGRGRGKAPSKAAAEKSSGSKRKR